MPKILLRSCTNCTERSHFTFQGICYKVKAFKNFDMGKDLSFNKPAMLGSRNSSFQDNLTNNQKVSLTIIVFGSWNQNISDNHTNLVTNKTHCIKKNLKRTFDLKARVAQGDPVLKKSSILHLTPKQVVSTINQCQVQFSLK